MAYAFINKNIWSCKRIIQNIKRIIQNIHYKWNFIAVHVQTNVILDIDFGRSVR